MDGAAGMVTFPGQEETTSQITTIFRGNKVIAHPDGVFPFYHVENILAAFFSPAFHIFGHGSGNKIGKAAFAATQANFFRLLLHRDFDVMT
jgi:hypothetical protein